MKKNKKTIKKKYLLTEDWYRLHPNSKASPAVMGATKKVYPEEGGVDKKIEKIPIVKKHGYLSWQEEGHTDIMDGTPMAEAGLLILGKKINELIVAVNKLR